MTEFGLIGHPVAHSMSRVMFTAAFRELGLDYSYGLFDVEEDDLKLFMENANFRGLNVTIPLKVRVLDYMDELSDDARLVGAVNTIEFGKSGLVGHNTDAEGFMRLLADEGVDVQGREFLVLGSGGAARAIVYKLALGGARVRVNDRKPERAQALADEVLRRTDIRVEASGLEDTVRRVDVLVNATAAGMSPNVDETPVPKEALNPALTVVDIVYNPLRTRLLAEAEERGCRTVGGVGMLVNQGAEAYRIWLREEPPRDAMRNAIMGILGDGT